MKKIRLMGIVILVLFVLPSILAVNADTELNVELQAKDLGSDKITIDGDSSDWANIESKHFDLEDPIDTTDTVTYEAKLSVAYDDVDIYFLVEIDEKYQLYNMTQAALDGNFPHKQTWALGLGFSINGTGSSRHMGSTSATTTTSIGFSDIMHWEAETAEGVLNTGSKGTEGSKGNSPTNLDDEYSSTTTDRSDDVLDQAWTGAWDHSDKTRTNGTAGTYTFELKRALTNNDDLDAQFEMNKKHEITIAFWSPFETSSGWTDAGHYTSSHVDGYFILGSVASAPGFELLIGLVALLIAVPIISKKRN